MNQTLTPALSDVAIDGQAISLAWPDGLRREFPFAWLRDNCACALCRHPGSGQRLLEPCAIPLDIHPAELRFEHDCLLVAWAPDGHASSYAGGWLRRSARAARPEGPGCGMRHRRRAAARQARRRRERPAAAAAVAGIGRRPRLRDSLGCPGRERRGRTSGGAVRARAGYELRAGVRRAVGRRARRTSPTPRSVWARTRTIPTATRCRRCSCCTAYPRARAAARARSSTASA